MSQERANDPLKYIKTFAYGRVQSVPGEEPTIDDLVNMAKFSLCKRCSRLWKDPVWEDYTPEEILIEYFSYLFAENETLRKEFEGEMDLGNKAYADIYNWLDQQVALNQNETRKKLDELPEKISFSPENNIDLEEK